MTKTNFGLTVKNKVLLGCRNLPQPTDNTGKRKSAFTAYLSHRLTGEVIVKNDVNPLKMKKVIAKEGLNNYPSRALSKISRLVLTDYDSLAYTVRLMGFFCMRNISMRSHIVMAKLEGDTFECAGDLESQSVNPFQFCHPHLTVNGRTSNSLGVHTHA